MNTKYFIITLIQFVTSSIFATQWSVSNHPANPGQFANIQAAINDVSVIPSDTLLIHGTGISYTDITLTKQLVLIGIGFNTQNNTTNRSHINQIFINSTAGSGSKFYGLTIGYFDVSSNIGEINNLVFENCYFTSQFAPNQNGIRFRSGSLPVNLFIKNCRFETCSYTAALLLDQTGGQSSSSVTVLNSWFSNCGGESSIANNRGNLIVSNCTFIGTQALLNVKYGVFQNCIFDVGGFPADCTDNVFNNCIAKEATLPPNNNSGQNNISNTAVVFLPNSLMLAPNSPGYTGGNDGQQLGIYGGSSTYTKNGEPANSPIIRNFIIDNTTIPQNGNLSIDILVTKPLKNN